MIYDEHFQFNKNCYTMFDIDVVQELQCSPQGLLLHLTGSGSVKSVLLCERLLSSFKIFHQSVWHQNQNPTFNQLKLFKFWFKSLPWKFDYLLDCHEYYRVDMQSTVELKKCRDNTFSVQNNLKANIQYRYLLLPLYS